MYIYYSEAHENDVTVNEERFTHLSKTVCFFIKYNKSRGYIVINA